MRALQLGRIESLEVWRSTNNMYGFCKIKSYAQWFYHKIMIQLLPVMWEWRILWRASNEFTFDLNYKSIWSHTFKNMLLVNNTRQWIKISWFITTSSYSELQLECRHGSCMWIIKKFIRKWLSGGVCGQIEQNDSHQLDHKNNDGSKTCLIILRCCFCESWIKQILHHW